MNVGVDRRNCAEDGMRTERFWKTVKYEYIYIRPEGKGREIRLIINYLSFAIAKQPYLEADRPLGKSLSRGKGFRDRVAWTIFVAGAHTRTAR